MAIFVLTHPDTISNEVEVLKEAVDMGCIVHIRKPMWTWTKTKSLVQSINRSSLVIHLEKEWKVEENKYKFHKKPSVSYPDPFQFVSSSIHGIDQLESLAKYQYCFCSPVFPSISKKGYTPRINPKLWIQSVEKVGMQDRLVALGGINDTNAIDLYDMGFSHIALMGYLWKNPELAIQQLEKIRTI